MAQSYLTWTKSAEERATWLSQLIRAAGYVTPATPEDLKAVAQKKLVLGKITCFFGVLAREKYPDSPYPSPKPSKEFIAELQKALEQEIPACVLVDQNIEIPSDLQEKVLWWRVALSDDSAVLALTPTIVRDVNTTFRDVDDKYTLKALNCPSGIRTTYIYDAAGRLRDVIESRKETSE